LIGDHVQFFARCRQFEDGLGKALASDSEYPRRAEDAALGEYLANA
jgi:hypothetical protein